MRTVWLGVAKSFPFSSFELIEHNLSHKRALKSHMKLCEPTALSMMMGVENAPKLICFSWKKVKCLRDFLEPG